MIEYRKSGNNQYGWKRLKREFSVTNVLTFGKVRFGQCESSSKSQSTGRSTGELICYRKVTNVVDDDRLIDQHVVVLHRWQTTTRISLTLTSEHNQCSEHHRLRLHGRTCTRIRSFLICTPCTLLSHNCHVSDRLKLYIFCCTKITPFSIPLRSKFKAISYFFQCKSLKCLERRPNKFVIFKKLKNL